MKATAALLAAACLSACVGNFAITDEKLPTATIRELCQSFVAAKTQRNEPAAVRVLNEIKRRNVFTANELANIARANASPGMSEQAGLCAWGYYWYGVNTTTTAHGTTKQYLFGDGTYNRRTYLYVTNGLVSATQE